MDGHAGGGAIVEVSSDAGRVCTVGAPNQGYGGKRPWPLPDRSGCPAAVVLTGSSPRSPGCTSAWAVGPSRRGRAMKDMPQALASTPGIVSRQVEGQGWERMGELEVD